MFSPIQSRHEHLVLKGCRQHRNGQTIAAPAIGSWEPHAKGHSRNKEVCNYTSVARTHPCAITPVNGVCAELGRGASNRESAFPFEESTGANTQRKTFLRTAARTQIRPSQGLGRQVA